MTLKVKELPDGTITIDASHGRYMLAQLVIPPDIEDPESYVMDFQEWMINRIDEVVESIEKIPLIDPRESEGIGIQEFKDKFDLKYSQRDSVLWSEQTLKVGNVSVNIFNEFSLSVEGNFVRAGLYTISIGNYFEFGDGSYITISNIVVQGKYGKDDPKKDLVYLIMQYQSSISGQLNQAIDDYL